MSKKIKIIILKNESPDDHLLWVKACDSFSEQLEYRIVDLTRDDWLEVIQSQPFDILLAKPYGLTAFFKQLYDERIYILAKVLKYPVFPKAEEIFIYENKRFLSYWLKANSIPHPRTDVFYYQQEALDFLISRTFPIAGKTNIGASGSGVRILDSLAEAKIYVKRTFSSKGAPKRWGPNFEKGNLLKRGLHYIFHPGDIRRKLRIYRTDKYDIQKGFVIFQEYIHHDYEWRVVRIGDSFFAHKKLKIGEKASGRQRKEFCTPPLGLLNFVKEITDKYQFYSQAVDIFETKDRGYLVNEMQCIFGQPVPYLMLVDGKPGRYRFINNNWAFEEGDFNQNESYDLRIKHILEMVR